MSAETTQCRIGQKDVTGKKVWSACADCGAERWVQRAFPAKRCRACCGTSKGPPYARAIKKVQKIEGGCWLWLGARTQTGYGQTLLGRSKLVMAHRLFYEHHVGPIPEGLELDHLCRNTRCVNPEHLEPVTRIENLRRAREARAKERKPE